MKKTFYLPHSFYAIAPLFCAVVVFFTITGIAMPTIPLHVHNILGLPEFYVGLVASAQFGVAFISRLWGGLYSDTKGPRKAMILGYILAMLAGVFYYISLLSISNVTLSMVILLFARSLLGGAESLLITSACAWAIMRAGPEKVGVVLSWLGAAMFSAYAFGAPLGSFLFSHSGFSGIAIATMLFPLIGFTLVLPLRAILPQEIKKKGSFSAIFKTILAPGTGLALSSIGFGAIVTFIVILFEKNEWQNVWIAFTVFSIFFILIRFLFGGVPDKFGGAKVAILCLAVEAIGQACLWLASSPTMAFIGASLTGLGYSLVYPCFGIEAVKGCDPSKIAVTTGIYTAFIDIALGFSGPILGLMSSFTGVQFVYFIAMLSVLCSMGVAIFLYNFQKVR